MKLDEFEKQLQRQSLRQIPSDWRAKILEKAAAAPASRARRSSLSLLTSRLLPLLWPHPKAWAGLAVLWVALIIVHFTTTDTDSPSVKRAEAPSPEVIVMLRQQQLLLSEFGGQSSPGDADRPKPNLQSPRSERQMKTMIV